MLMCFNTQFENTVTNKLIVLCAKQVLTHSPFVQDLVALNLWGGFLINDWALSAKFM